MASNSEYEQRRCFEDEKYLSFSDEMSYAVWRHHMVVTEIDKLITKSKRITLKEPNTEGYLKECLSLYEKENLKTK
jgi:hypothetical protein